MQCFGNLRRTSLNVILIILSFHIATFSLLPIVDVRIVVTLSGDSCSRFAGLAHETLQRNVVQSLDLYVFALCSISRGVHLFRSYLMVLGPSI